MTDGGKPGYVDLSVEEDETVEETCTSSDADSTVEVLEKSIDEVVMDESSPARAKVVQDKEGTSKDGVDGALRKRKSGVEEGLLLEEGMEVMSIEEVVCPSSVKKLLEKPGINSSCHILRK